LKEKALEGTEEDIRSYWMTLRKKQILQLETESTRRQGRRRRELLDDLKKKEITELERESTRRQSGELALENAAYLTYGKTTKGTNQSQFLHMVLLRLPSSCYGPYLKN
jgi:hypothetical protein